MSQDLQALRDDVDRLMERVDALENGDQESPSIRLMGLMRQRLERVEAEAGKRAKVLTRMLRRAKNLTKRVDTLHRGNDTRDKRVEALRKRTNQSFDGANTAVGLARSFDARLTRVGDDNKALNDRVDEQQRRINVLERPDMDPPDPDSPDAYDGAWHDPSTSNRYSMPARRSESK